MATTMEARQTDIQSWRELSRATRIYVGAVTILGAAAIVQALPHVLVGNLPLFLTLTLLSVVASIAKVTLPVPRSASTLTICYVMDFTTLLLLGAPAATLTAASGAWSQCVLRAKHRTPTYQTWFSMGALAVTVQITGRCYASLGGMPGPLRSSFHVEALIAAALTFFVVNSLLVAGAVALSTGQPAARVWIANYLWSWPGHFLGFAVAVGAATGIGRSGFWLVPLAVVSLALSYDNFKVYVTRFTDSVTDPLTGIPNMRYLISQFTQELARSQRTRSSLALILIDLDGFKAINDSYGHRAGDVALQAVAQCLQQSIRPYDICARYGGDEFVAVLPGCDLDDAWNKAVALQDVVTALTCEVKRGVVVPLRVSVGAALFPADGESFEQLLAVADVRMFQDKNRRATRSADATSRRSDSVPALPPAAPEQDLGEELVQVQKLAALGQLTGGVAHDFNNALTAILGYSDLLIEQIGPDKPIGHDLLEIASAAKHAAALTHHLLAFSRKQESAMTAVDLNHVVGSTEPMLRRLIAETITIKTELAGSLAPIMANVTQLEQILINLSVNARDAMPRGGVLTIATRTVELDASGAAGCRGASPGRYTSLTVTDTGVGMTREVQERIFQPFFTTKEAGRGTGLGLTVVTGIVSQAGGFLTIESEVGRGTTFRIHFPEVAGEAEERATQESGVESPAPTGAETILLVEDEEGVREFATTALSRHGYRVLEAQTGEAALALLEDKNPPVDLVLTDLVLPGMDGRDLAASIDRKRPGTPVLFTTGYGDRAPLSDVEILEKPFTARTLLQRTRDLLDRVVA